MTKKKVIGRVWLAATVVVALYFVVSYLRENEVQVARLMDADLRVLGAAILAYTAYYFSISMTWMTVLSSVSRRHLGLLESASQIVIINLGKYIPGKIWGLAARAARLSELEYSTSEISQASFLEQALLLLTGLWLLLLAAFIVYGNPMLLLLLLVTTVGIVIARNTSSFVDIVGRRWPRAERVLHLVKVNVDLGATAILLLGFALTWLFLVATFMLMCASLVEISFDARSASVFILCITSGYLAGFIAIFAPGGVGVREAVGAVALTELMPLEKALFLMLLFRVWVVVFELVAGLLVVGTKVAAPPNQVDATDE